MPTQRLRLSAQQRGLWASQLVGAAALSQEFNRGEVPDSVRSEDTRARRTQVQLEEEHMSDTVYKVIELVGTSDSSWEDAAKNAVELAGKSLKDLRIAEVKKLDVKVENGRVVAYRAKLSLSFKYESGGA